MKLEQLESFTMIVDSGSFRAAAAQLNRSQSALSKMIKNLEAEFGILLFDRSLYRPTLTEAGHAFLELARSTLESANYASRVANELGRHELETSLKISVDPLVPSRIIQKLARECAKPVRPVELILQYSISKDKHEPLIRGALDLTVGHCSDYNERVEKIPLEQVKVQGAFPKVLLNGKKSPTRAMLESLTQIVTYDRKFDEEPDQLIPKRVFQGKGPRIFVSDHFVKRKLIEDGVGWGRLSEAEVTASPQLIAVQDKILPVVPLTLCLIRARNTALGPIAQAIWKSFSESAQP